MPPPPRPPPPPPPPPAPALHDDDPPAHVTPLIHLGSLATLAKHGLEYQRVLSVLGGVTETRVGRRLAQENRLLELAMDDVHAQPILPALPQAIAYMAAAEAENEPVLVHCAAGCSRSVAMVMAYLLHCRLADRDGEDDDGREDAVTRALRFVQRVRPQAQPNASFIYQLRVFTALGAPRDPLPRTDLLVLHTRMLLAAIRARPTNVSLLPARPPTSWSALAAAPALPQRYACRQCRRAVFTARHLLPPHDVAAWHTHAELCPLRSGTDAAVMHIVPPPWLLDQLTAGSMEDAESGELRCPHPARARRRLAALENETASEPCGTPFGRYHWIRRSCPSCHASVAPVFAVPRSSVDLLPAPMGGP
ncbi:tyrosine protein phosphatase yvh1 [Allomyces arbusculus]|nr:tyrosine protein phosphatase yvh1 [Allomyces arbusculus]